MISFVQAQARIIATHAETESETVITTHPDSTSITVRVAGVDIESPAASLVDVVGALVEAASWAFEGDHFSVSIPRVPESASPLASAGYAALASKADDPWLTQIHRSVEELLGAVERGDLETAASAVLSTKAHLRDM